MQGWFRFTLGYIGAAGAVVVFGAIAWATSLLVPLPRVSVLFLCAVLASAVLWGLGPALFAAALGVAAAAFFFYPPIYDFGVASSQDLLDLIVLSVVAVISSAASEEIRRQRRAAEEARVTAKTEELREALLNSISHDLQTPLASILGAASAMQSFDQLYDSRARADLVATIREEAERLDSFIGNILDLTRIRAGALNPRLEFVELTDIIDSAIRKSHHVTANHELRVDLPDNIPMMRLDLFLMEHAIVKLLENAAKYSPAGSRIDLTARLDGDTVQIDVRDRGIGLAAADLPNIFNKFYRGGMNDAKAAGTGLGLAICRAFVEANDGTIEARSAGTGRGSTFRIMLPVATERSAGSLVLNE